MRLILCISMVIAALAAVGCEDRSATSQSAAQQTTSAASEILPAGLILTQAPQDPKEVIALKDAKAGDEVILHGRVGGRVEPFVDGRAAFQMVDLSLKSCKELPDDNCPTPWDYCCDADVNKKSASVQVVGADGKPLRTGLKGVGGLQPLSEVTIRGTVAKAGESGPVIVNATGIHVKG